MCRGCRVRWPEGSGPAWAGEEWKAVREAQGSVSQQHLGVPGLEPPSSRIHLSQVRLKRLEAGRAESRVDPGGVSVVRMSGTRPS